MFGWVVEVGFPWTCFTPAGPAGNSVVRGLLIPQGLG